MNWRRVLAPTIACLLILIVLHYTLRPLLGWRALDRLSGDRRAARCSVRVRPGVAACYGFVLGLVADSLAPATFGAGALAMTIVGFAASWLKAVFFADNVVLNGFFFFVGKWVFDLIYLVVDRGAPPRSW